MTATASIAIPTTMPLPTLCLFSTSKRLADRVLRTCPLSLRMGEHQECPHRKQARVDLGEGEKPLTVTACECPASPAPLASVPSMIATAIATSPKEPSHMTNTPRQGEPLWPQPLPVVGVTGEYKAGKTLFTLTIDPTRTLYFDTEKSGETYEALGLGFTRIDVWREMLRLHPNGHKPIDLFQWWLDQVKKIQPGQYTVVALDTVSEIESGLCDWVNKNPGYFGHTVAQYMKMEGIYWGDVKEYWKGILADLASRCTTFAFTAHMGDEWKKGGGGGGPTGKRKPKGKATLMELASLYLQLERKANNLGVEPRKPTATVLKSRLVNKLVGADGEFELVETLPPRLPVATPHAIRQYMLAPAGARETTEEERARTEVLSEDDKLRLAAATAEANRDAEMARLEQLQRRSEGSGGTAANVPTAPKRQQQVAPPATATAPTAPTTPATQPPAAGPVATAPVATSPTVITTPPTAEQKAEITDLIAQLKLTGEQWSAMLATYGATSGKDLSSDQAADLIVTLKRQNDGSYFQNPGDPDLAPQPKLTEAQKGELLTLKEGLKALGMKAEHWAKYLADQGVTTALDLTEAKAEVMIRALRIDLAESQEGGGYIPF